MREVKKITTKSGIEVEMYTYITGREAREITNVFLEGMKFQVGADGQTKTNEVNATLSGQAQDKAIELLIRSVAGKSDKVLANVLDLPKADFDEVIAELDKIQNGLSAEKKTV